MLERWRSADSSMASCWAPDAVLMQKYREGQKMLQCVFVDLEKVSSGRKVCEDDAEYAWGQTGDVCRSDRYVGSGSGITSGISSMMTVICNYSRKQVGETGEVSRSKTKHMYVNEKKTAEAVKWK